MPRKGEVPKRKPLPDPKFTDQPVDTRRRVTKFVNTVMESGKKSIAEGIVYRAFDLGMRWIITASRDRSDGRTMQEKLASELLDASSNKGNAVKKREDTHKMADANKAFAHYRW